MNKKDNIKILVVEDDRISRHVLDIIIKQKFKTFQIYFGKNGLDGFDVYKQTLPKIIFMDVNMPSISGIECINNIRKYEEDNNLDRSYIILYTATAPDFEKNKELLLNIDDVLNKPIEPDIVVRTINRYLKGE